MKDPEAPADHDDRCESLQSETNGKSDAARKATPDRPSRHLIRAGLSAALGFILWVLTSRFGESFDYQYGYFARNAVAIVFFLLVAYRLHRGVKSMGHRWIVPAMVGVLLVTPSVLYKFKHFNGEMVPQFEWRFGGQESPELITEVAATRQDGGSNQDAHKASLVPPEDSLPEFDRLTWSQFLGNDRNGVLKDREFAVPENDDDVTEVWRQGVGKGWASFAIADGRAFTLEQRDDMECVTAYRLADGALLWIRQHPVLHTDALGGIGPRSTPLVVDGRVYTQGATGFVQCLHAATGETVWEADLLKLAGWNQETAEQAVVWGRAGSPLMVDEKIVLPFGAMEDAEGVAKDGRALIALDAVTGEVVWTGGEDQISYASPVVMTLRGVRQIVSVNEASVSGHDIDNGTQLWSFEWPGQSNAAASCSSTMAAGPDRFIVGKGYFGGSSLVEVDLAGGEWAANEIWHSTEALRTKFNHACIDGDVAYSISNGRLEAATVSDGNTLWSQPHRGRYEQGQAILVDDVLVVQAEDGYVAFVEANPDRFREIARIEALSSKTWNIPVICGRYLVVRNDREAVCYRLPAK